MKIPLIDVDWTLIKGGNKPLGDSVDFAIRTVFGILASYTEISIEGKIENEIILEVLVRHGLTREEVIPRLDEIMKARMDYFLQHEDEGNDTPLPGSTEFLRKLKKKNIPVGVLTGVAEPFAWRRLERAGLRQFIDFGAFGNLAFRRTDLIPLALQRLNVLGVKHALTDLVIIGDTPRDIEAAKEIGIPSIGVATGKYTFDELTQTGADLVIPSLVEIQQICSFLEVPSTRGVEFKG